jgi:hypothetical protein
MPAGCTRQISIARYAFGSLGQENGDFLNPGRRDLAESYGSGAIARAARQVKSKRETKMPSDSTKLSGRLWLDPIPAELRDTATAALEVRDVEGFLEAAPNEYGLDLVSMNFPTLQATGLYERALLAAFIGTETHRRFSLSSLCRLFSQANRARLRSAGDPLPGPGPFRVYRGVAGATMTEKRIRSIAWTGSLERAWRFANRYDLPGPAVYSIIIDEPSVLAYQHEGAEFIVDFRATTNPTRTRVPTSRNEIQIQRR